MKLVITLTLSAESKVELMESFPTQVRELNAAFRDVAAKGGFGLPAEKVEIRCLVKAGRWD